MNEFFLEIDVDKIILTNLQNYQLPLPVYKNKTSTIVFNTEEEFYKYLIEIEKASTIFLSEYWLFKTPELIAKNRYIVKLLTVLHEAHAKKLQSI
ncbi:MAG: hypothetical protein ACRYGB_10110 [Janthinobacterium lividum]